jgi:hypothetical protein
MRFSSDTVELLLPGTDKAWMTRILGRNQEISGVQKPFLQILFAPGIK